MHVHFLPAIVAYVRLGRLCNAASAVSRTILHQMVDIEWRSWPELLDPRGVSDLLLSCTLSSNPKAAVKGQFTALSRQTFIDFCRSTVSYTLAGHPIATFISRRTASYTRDCSDREELEKRRRKRDRLTKHPSWRLSHELQYSRASRGISRRYKR